MSHRITAALGAAALVVGLGVVGAPAASAGDCDTWQYKVTETAAIYASDGSSNGVASRGFYLNVTERDGERPVQEFGRYYGSVYFASKQYYTFGGILVSKLDYVDCW